MSAPEAETDLEDGEVRSDEEPQKEEPQAGPVEVRLVNVVRRCIECSCCGQTYSKAGNADRHMRKKHGVTLGGRALTEEVRQREQQKGGRFRPVFPLSARELAGRVDKSPGKTATQLAIELTKPLRLSAREGKDVGNYVRCIRAGMRQYCDDYADLRSTTVCEAIARLKEGRSSVQDVVFEDVELD